MSTTSMPLKEEKAIMMKIKDLKKKKPQAKKTDEKTHIDHNYTVVIDRIM